MTAQEIDERRRARDIAADHAEGLAEGALDYRWAVHDPVALGDAAAARTVETDGMHLVEIGHRAEAVGHVAQCADRRDVAVHRIDRFEADELWPVGGHAFEQAFEIGRIVVAKYVLL